jgi:hypothetical protein
MQLRYTWNDYEMGYLQDICLITFFARPSLRKSVNVFNMLYINDL